MLKSLSDENYTFLLIALAVLVRVTAFVGLNGGYDDIAYANIAWQIAHGVFSWTDSIDHYGSRYMVILPAALSYKFFGFGDYSSALFPFLCSIAQPVMLWKILIGMNLSREGRWAALFLAIFPVNVIYGTMLYPNEITACLVTAAALMFLKQKNSHLFTSGVFLALAALTYAPSIVLASVFILYRGAHPGDRRKLAVSWCAGFAAVIAAEMLFSYLLTGQWFWHVKSLYNAMEAFKNFTEYSLWIYPKAMFAGNLYGLSLFGMYYPLTMAAIALITVRGELEKILFPLSWLAILFAVHEFGSKSLIRFDEIYKQLRFLTVLSAPACWILGHAAGILWREHRRKTVLSACFLLFATSITGVHCMRRYRINGMTQWKEAAAFLESVPELPLWTDAHADSLKLNTLMERNRLCSYYEVDPADPACARPLKEMDVVLRTKGYLVTFRKLKAVPERVFAGGLAAYRLPL
ncbi:MAG: glycosyltransferase family 39 protein [bacterium]